jgi:predicted DCC family thiol-disulfide oxidoreductase YuxK
MQRIVFFDGYCNLCSSMVQFIIKRDHRNYFKFAALQSDFAKTKLAEFKIDQDQKETFILLEGNQLFTRSTAALNVVKKLNSLWPLLYVLIIIPPVIRNFVYSYVARNRYNWFGKKESCWIPTKDLKSKFLDS